MIWNIRRPVKCSVPLLISAIIPISLVGCLKQEQFHYTCSDTGLPWLDAVSSCRRKGGDIISLTDQSSLEAVNRCLNLWPSQPNLFAVGLNWTEAYGWRWLRDNSSLKYWNNTNGRIPHNCSVCKNCVVSLGLSDWYRHNCSSKTKVNFICEFKPSQISHSSPNNQNCSKVCYNGGSCMRKLNQSVCSCSHGYTGDACTDRLVCQKYCGKHGWCIHSQDGREMCSCDDTHMGEDCSTVLSSDHNCLGTPCYYGMCKNNTCVCFPGYFGAKCETSVEDKTGISAKSLNIDWVWFLVVITVLSVILTVLCCVITVMCLRKRRVTDERDSYQQIMRVNLDRTTDVAGASAEYSKLRSFEEQSTGGSYESVHSETALETSHFQQPDSGFNDTSLV